MTGRPPHTVRHRQRASLGRIGGLAFIAFAAGSSVPFGLWLAWQHFHPAPAPETAPPGPVLGPFPAPVVSTPAPVPPERVRVERITSFADMVDKVVPAVVSVYPSRFDPDSTRPSASPSGPAPPKRRFAAGSGVLVSEDGYILTTHHLLAEDDGAIAGFVDVTLSNGRRHPAALVGSDPLTDIAVLRIDAGGEKLPAPLTFGDSETLRVGDIVFAVGNPLDVGLTVTMGIVSGTRRSHLGILGPQGAEKYVLVDNTTGASVPPQPIEDFIQTDATINPGNSGGPLVDGQGRLCGINSATLTAARSGGNTGIGFAIPGNLALQVMSGIIETGRTQRALLGIKVDSRPKESPTPEGVLLRGVRISEVEPGQAADKAGLKPGDLLLYIGDRPVRYSREVRSAVASLAPGTEVDIKLWREPSPSDQGTMDSGYKHLNVILGRDDVSESKDAVASDERKLPGVTYRQPTDEDRKRFSLPPQVKGLMLASVAKDSRLAHDLRPGVLITEINGKPALAPADLSKYLTEGMNRLVVYDHGAVAEILLMVRPSKL